MATSMQFGPEWMRKAPVKNNSSNSIGKDPSSPAGAASSGRSENGATPTGGPAATGKRNGAMGGGLGAVLNGPTPVTSPTVTSPGAFSFAAAAGGAASAAAAGSHQHQAFGGSSQDGDSVASSALSNGAASAKDRQSREKLLSLYSTDRPAKPAQSEASPLEGGAGTDKAGSAGRKKTGADREQRRPSNFAELGAGAGPLSPSLGGEPRGINARSTSGGSSGGFGSAGTSNWDRADKERPGLFQRASSSALTSTVAAGRPLSPSIPRERFGGIQGGVLSGVGPQSRKRMDSDNGSTAGSRGGAKSGSEDVTSPSQGSAQASRGSAGFAEAFSSNKARGKAGVGEGTGQAVQEPEGNEGGAPSARFGRTRDRQPGEGPIGPPADGSAGFNKFAGYDRKRERQASHFKAGTVPGDAEANGTGHGDADGRNEQHGRAERRGSAEDHGRGALSSTNAHDTSMDSDLAQHATAVLGSLKLDEDDPSAQMLPPNPEQPTPPTWSADTALWLYRDPSGQVQGPFTAVVMQDWYRQSYFSDDLLVRRQEDDEFRPLVQVIAAIGNALQPFLVPPHSWLQPPDAFKNAQGQPDTRRSSLVSPPGSGDDAASDSRIDQDHDASRFAVSGQVDSLGGGGGGGAGWNGASQNQQQWPSQLNLGFGTTTPQPMSPFGRPDMFAGQGAGLDNRFRTQEELVALIRERELQEQRQAAAAAAARGQNLGYGQLDPFMGVLGRGGWDAPGAASWAPHGGLPSFDPAFTGHPSPLMAERQAFEAFHQRGGAGPDQGGAWAKGPSTPRSHFDQPNPFNNRPGQWDAQGAWSSQGNMTPEALNRQAHDFQEGGFRHESAKPFSDPIGTPRRARSPAAPSPALEQKSDAFEDRREESATTTAVEPIPEADGLRDSAQAQAATPKEVEAQAQEEAHPAKEPEVKATEPKSAEPPKAEVEAAPAPTAVEEPGPEQLWPQSPSAVEFASEPDLSSMPGLTLPSKAPTSVAATTDARRTANRSDTKGEAAKRPTTRQQQAAAAAATATSGNVRVVSQEQFRRAPEEESASLNQVPLSAWLPDAAGESSTPTSKPAPWASRDDASSSGTPGPSLREIQEAEAKRAEARKAAERAAAAQPGFGGGGFAGALDAHTRHLAAPTSGSVGSALKPKPAPAAAPAFNDINSPSPEFVRYLKDNLKGLTIRVDDFIEMLMSFPLDPSPDVIEIIAESVYANSSTLDGRRFAADFVSKRKMDVQGRQQHPYSSSSSVSSGGGASSASTPFQSKWSSAGSSGGMGTFGSGAAGFGGGSGSSGGGIGGRSSGGATSPQMARSAADVMKGPGSAKAGVDSFGGFKVVKAKGSKKRAN
ncbi:uncharacterized protein PFL1_03706 [Pseudozyma flocculosa PF-1]|uniref:GYF domain-containing protein n=1 Tax=Pseudozyma flocculosa PF-1 TaxID=1277687 RepID=A0A061HA54_9BASI|nr:uncharacterized protein PFL1_03706 [Pseudozyma flocculosa PF-1]EPQ28905.1 hypothetical protein PFL1_03706 [Pseudozyma flocculosa PF-1]